MKRVLVLLLPLLLGAETVRIASYNVENLFDLRKSGDEYTEYIPGTGYGWNERTFTIKVRNVARVICDLKPDIIGLQEVESDAALAALQKVARECGTRLPYRAIADAKETTVKNALLSRYPILQKREVAPSSERLRSILEAVVDVKGRRLRLFVNHWKSRSGPESLRLLSARVLARRLEALPPAEEYILLGDFNSDWNEWRTIRGSRRLDDTGGVTGINHVLGTIRGDRSVAKETIVSPFHYDLWLELPPQRRWSHNFFGHKSALDHILLPASMFNGRGFDYVDRSFRVFKPAYLFTPKGAIFRWQKAKRGHGKHLGEGYSDHLPIYAELSTRPFQILQKGARHDPSVESAPSAAPRKVSVADLYELPLGEQNLRLEGVVVIHKKGKIAILKEPKGRAIAVYKDIEGLLLGHAYDVTVRRLYDYRGLREITRLKILEDLGARDISPLLLSPGDELSHNASVNEVVSRISGIYRRGRLYYGEGRSIRLYFRRKSERPKSGERITLRGVRIGIYKNRPEIVVD
ncbi:endonuclease/exonuclease/phosphatase family protein [Hydrogenimonas sp.]